MKKNFCAQCYSQVTCSRPCAIVEAELRGKGVHETNECGSIKQRPEEIDLVFWFDPYHERIIPEDSDYSEESKP